MNSQKVAQRRSCCLYDPVPALNLSRKCTANTIASAGNTKAHRARRRLLNNSRPNWLHTRPVDPRTKLEDIQGKPAKLRCSSKKQQISLYDSRKLISQCLRLAHRKSILITKNNI